jgi:hypothetical protein
MGLLAEAFSSEVANGSREENAKMQKQEPRSDSIGSEKALDINISLYVISPQSNDGSPNGAIGL